MKQRAVQMDSGTLVLINNLKKHYMASLFLPTMGLVLIVFVGVYLISMRPKKRNRGNIKPVRTSKNFDIFYNYE